MDLVSARSSCLNTAFAPSTSLLMSAAARSPFSTSLHARITRAPVQGDPNPPMMNDFACTGRQKFEQDKCSKSPFLIIHPWKPLFTQRVPKEKRKRVCLSCLNVQMSLLASFGQVFSCFFAYSGVGSRYYRRLPIQAHV